MSVRELECATLGHVLGKKAEAFESCPVTRLHFLTEDVFAIAILSVWMSGVRVADCLDV